MESRPSPALALSNQQGGKVSPVPPPSFTNTCPAPITPLVVDAAEMGGLGPSPWASQPRPHRDPPTLKTGLVSWEAPGSPGNDGRFLSPPASMSWGHHHHQKEREGKELPLRGTSLFQNREAGLVRIASVTPHQYLLRGGWVGTAVTGAPERLTGHGAWV